MLNIIFEDFQFSYPCNISFKENRGTANKTDVYIHGLVQNEGMEK